MSLRVVELLFDRRRGEGRRWHPLRQLEGELGQVGRSMDQLVEVISLLDGEDRPRRVLCPGGRTLLPAPCRPLLERRLAAL